MRITPRFAPMLEAVRLEPREIERPQATAPVRCPAGWTQAQVEAWLDWLDEQPQDWPALAPAPPSVDGDPLLAGLERWAMRLAAWGRALGLLENDAGARDLAAELRSTVLLGLAAPGPGRAGGARVHPVAGDDPGPTPPAAWLDLSDPKTLDAFRLSHASAASRRRGAMAEARVAEALRAVNQAVERCGGPLAECCSPDHNPALARAARVAREAGAEDASILAATRRAPLAAQPQAATIAPVAVLAVEFLHLTEAVDAASHLDLIVCAEPADAAATADAALAARAALHIGRLQALERREPGALAAAARLWTVALEIELASAFCADSREAQRRFALRPIAFDLCGAETAALAQGLDPEQAAARLAEQAAEIVRAARQASAEMAQRLSRPGGAATQRHGLIALGVGADAAVRLRLGEGQLRAVDAFECAGGDVSLRLHPSIADALRGLDRDPDEAERWLFGHRTFVGAPGVGHEALRALGFTDIELQAVEQALARADDLADAVNEDVVGAGFVHDVLGLAPTTRRCSSDWDCHRRRWRRPGLTPWGGAG